ncbi:MAG: ABC transporter permease subunit [Actinomyces bowdenii]|nr:ABC transporter permease subunit [Actinomyces bowdenii]
MTRNGVMTVAQVELRQRVRSTRWRIMLLTWALVLLLVCGGLTLLTLSTDEPLRSATPWLYDIIVCFVMGIGLIVAPTLSSTSINGDRADATLALLQATALRPAEIALGKLMAAWLAALAFLAVALPFLLVLVAGGGASAWVVLAHLVVLLITLASVCAIGLGLSALTARTSASTVLTYLVVTALVIGTPLAMIIVAPVVRDQQEVIVHSRSSSPYLPGSPEDEAEPQCTQSVRTEEIHRVERIWWLLAPNPFIILSDVSARYGRAQSEYSPDSLLGTVGEEVDAMRTPEPASRTEDYCTYSEFDSVPPEDSRGSSPAHLAFWPASLLFLVLLGTGAASAATRRLAVPAKALPRGIRLA